MPQQSTQQALPKMAYMGILNAERERRMNPCRPAERGGTVAVNGDYFAYSTFDGLIHFLPSFSVTVPVTVPSFFSPPHTVS